MDARQPTDRPFLHHGGADERERRGAVLSAERDANDVLRNERLAAVDKENAALERLVQRLCATA